MKNKHTLYYFFIPLYAFVLVGCNVGVTAEFKLDASIGDSVSVGGSDDGDSNADGDSESGEDTAGETDADTDADTDGDTDTDTDTDIDGDTDTDTDVDTDSDTDADTDVDTDGDTDADADNACPYSCIRRALCSGSVESGYTCSRSTQVCCNASTDGDTDVDTDTDADVDTDTDGDTDSDTDTVDGVTGPGTAVPSPGDTVVSVRMSDEETVKGYAVSGHWTKAGSPYRVTGNILVQKGSTLTIDPGVKVEFQGRYSLRLFGGIYAVGTEGSPIVFTTTDADIARGGKWVGWRGIRIPGYDYGDTYIDHGAGIYNFQYCEVGYVDKSDGPEEHPWEDWESNVYVHGTTVADLIFDNNYIHHGRTGLFSFYGAQASVLEGDPYFYDNVFEYEEENPSVRVAHVYNPNGRPTYRNVHFVGGAVRHFIGTPLYASVADTWDTPMYLDGVEVTDCGDRQGAPWFLAWNTDPPNYASITYTPPGN